MNDATKRYIGWALIAVAVIAAGFLGARYPIPEPPPDLSDVYIRLQSLETTSGMPTSFAATGSGEGYTNFTSIALSDDLYVGDDASVIGDLDAATLTVSGALDFGGALDVDGATTLNSTLDVDGATTLNSTLDVDGNVSSGTGAFTVTDNVYITGALDVAGNVNSSTGAVTITDNLYITGTLTADGATALNGALDVDGNISSGTGAVTVTDNALITGTLNVSGNTTLAGTLTLEGVAFSGPVTFGSASTVVSGTTIAHGLGTTPTVALLTPGSTGGYTATVYIMATDTTSLTIGVQDGNTVATLYWLAGR